MQKAETHDGYRGHYKSPGRNGRRIYPYCKEGSSFLRNRPPVSDSLKRLEIGGTLGSGELLRICKVLENTAQVKSYGRHENADDAEDCLDPLFSQLEPLTPLSTEIRRCIPEEDEISDDASSTLLKIRRSMNQINDKVHAHADLSGERILTFLSPGSHHHHAGRPVLCPGKGRVQKPGPGADPRPVRHRIDPVYRAHVRGKAEQ